MATISSTISTRPTPPIPPASQAHEPLKRDLAHRLKHTILAHSSACSLAFYILFLSGDGDLSLPSRLLSPHTWLVASLAWTVGVLPVVVLRKAILSADATGATSPARTMAVALSKPSTRRALAVYTVSALFLLALHMYDAPTLKESVHLSLFVKSRKHPFYLNGRLIFLVMAQAWFALSFAVRNIMLERFVFRWSRNASSNTTSVYLNLPILFMTIGLFTLLSLTAYNVIVGLTRMIVLPILIRIPVISAILRPLAAHFVRGPWTLILPLRHHSLEFRAFVLGWITLANWEFAETLFDVHIPQPIYVSHTTADPNVTLVSGTTSSNLVFLHFTYAELRNIATDSNPSSSTRRTALFSDQKFIPSLWSTLTRASLLRLGEDYQTLLRRGAPAPPPPTTTATTAAVTSKLSNPPSTPILRQPICKPPQQSPLSRILNTFASDSDLSKATNEVVAEVESAARDVHVPELFRSVAPSPASVVPISSSAVPPSSATQKPSAIVDPRALVARAVHAWGGSMVQYIPPQIRLLSADLYQWATRERIHKCAEKALPHRDLDALIIESLSALVCASLTEDRYGTVQRDIPRILEALVSFLVAVEEYKEEVRGMYMALAGGNANAVAGAGMQEEVFTQEQERTHAEVAKATEIIDIVEDALKTGISDIVRTFGDKLSAFRVPQKTAKRLQLFF
ncbi:nucleoporin protein Ndc1-Nup [Scleroderma yunnanense]